MRNYSLLRDKEELTASETSDARSMLSLRFSQLMKKLWNPFNFKGHVSPHEFMEAVSVASSKRFRCDDRSMKTKGFGGQADPLQFLAWLLNSLKSHRKVIDKSFQGELEITRLEKSPQA